MVKKFAHEMRWKSKYLRPEIETCAKYKICEFPSPFSDIGQIMTGES